MHVGDRLIASGRKLGALRSSQMTSWRALFAASLLPRAASLLPRFCLGRMENVGQRRALMRGHLRSSEGLDRLFSLVGAEGLEPPTFAL
jgi:hypothetical protein